MSRIKAREPSVANRLHVVAVLCAAPWINLKDTRRHGSINRLGHPAGGRAIMCYGSVPDLASRGHPNYTSHRLRRR
jgi:hypothetical protein